jgi:mannosyltransferase
MTTATVVINPAPGRRRRDLRAPLAVGAVTALALVLRLAGIGDKSLWLDEAFSTWVANLPLDQLWRTTLQLDTHPPLYYTLLHFWISPQSGEVALRSLSALWEVATVPVVYLTGRAIGGRRLGLLVALLQAVSPLHVWYAQQGRMYAMLTFFAAVALLCLVRLLVGGLARGATLLCWAGFVLATVLTMLSQNTGVLLPVTVAVFVAGVAVHRVVDERRRRADQHATSLLGRFGPPSRPGVDLRLWSAGLVAAAVLWLPWLPGFLAQSGRVDADFWIPAPSAQGVLDHVRDLVSAWAPAGTQIPLLVGAVAMVGLAGWSLRHRPALFWLLVLLVVGPAVGELLVSARRPIFYAQTLVWTSVPLTLLLGVGLRQLRPRALAAGATALLLVANLASLVAYYRAPGSEDWRGAAALLAAQAEPGDVVLFDAGWTEIAFNYYYRSTGGPPIETHGLPVDPFDRGVLEPKVAASDLPRLDQLTAGRDRVWLVLSHDAYTDPDRVVTGWLGDRMRVVEQQDLAAMRIQAYESG